MQVEVDIHLEELIREKVESGRFHSPGDVVRDAVLQLDERDRRLQRLQAEVALGLAQVEEGNLIDLTPELWDELERQADEDMRSGKPVKDAVRPSAAFDPRGPR